MIASIGQFHFYFPVGVVIEIVDVKEIEIIQNMVENVLNKNQLITVFALIVIHLGFLFVNISLKFR